MYLARHATAAAGAGEPDHAWEIARTVVDIAVETRSERMRRELVALQGRCGQGRMPRSARISPRFWRP